MGTRPTTAKASPPLFLKAWIGLQIITFVVGPMLNPRRGMGWGSVVFWILVAGALAYAMARHSKTAWMLALLSAVFTIVGGTGFFVNLSEGLNRETLWYVFGLVVGLSELAILVSPSARAWVKEPTVRHWDP